MQFLTILNTTLLLSIPSSSLIATEIQDCPIHKDIYDIKDERLISKKAQGSEFYIRVNKRIRKAIIHERPRSSRVAQDLTTLVKISTAILKIPTGNMIFSAKHTPNKCITYKQSFKRAFIEIETIDDMNNSQYYNFVVGDTENIYLSADMPITSIDELYYDSQTGTLREQERPASFYLGINYKIGDLFMNYPIDKFYNNISLKALAKISEKPTESMGFGLGYHISDGIEIFVAKLWTQDNRNIQRDSIGHTATLTYGVSFNLNKGLEWIKNIH